MAASFCRRSFLNYKNCLFQTQKRTGYVVLFPETPEEIAECNVISLENLPQFSKLNTHICKQIIYKYAEQYDVGAWELDKHLEKLKDFKSKDVFRHVQDPLETLSVPFLSSWGVVQTLYLVNRSLMPSVAFFPIRDRVLQIRGDKFNVKSIYSACKTQLELNGEKLSDEERRVLQKFVWEGTLSGLELDDKDRQSLQRSFTQQEMKKKAYAEKFERAKTRFKQVIEDEKFASESPLDLLRNTSLNSADPLKGPWIVTLRNAVYERFLEYCKSREARRHIWLSYNQICSARGDPTLRAVTEVEEIRKRRRDLAKILGFPSYAHLCMKTKMAGSVENVQNVLTDLLESAKNAQEKEIYELDKFIYKNGFNESLELWDLPYWKRVHRQHLLGLDEMALSEYFPLSQVLLGLIALCEQLFGIIIEEQDDVETWNADVRYFRILNEKTKTKLGGFYFDPYSRPEKVPEENNCGWFVPIRSRSKTCASLPLSSLIFSFTPPSQDKPSLLYLREVEMLFEKFGQMLQHTLTQMNYSEVSGLANIEWDAVQISNKFLRFWLTEKGTLESISGHYDSGEPLPSHTLDKLCNIHKQMAGTELSMEIYRSNLDLELHLQDDTCIPIAEKLWPKHLLFQLHPLDYHPFGFSQSFITPWGSSYYSHIWSKMVAADIFSAFVEAGFNNQEEISALGRRFRSTFLALGGGCEAGEIFRRFRGRDPNPKLLKKLLDVEEPVLNSKDSPDFVPEPAMA